MLKLIANNANQRNISHARKQIQLLSFIYEENDQQGCRNIL